MKMLLRWRRENARVRKWKAAAASAGDETHVRNVSCFLRSTVGGKLARWFCAALAPATCAPSPARPAPAPRHAPSTNPFGHTHAPALFHSPQSVLLSRPRDAALREKCNFDLVIFDSLFKGKLLREIVVCYGLI